MGQGIKCCFSCRKPFARNPGLKSKFAKDFLDLYAVGAAIIETPLNTQTGGWEVGTDRVQRIWRREGLKTETQGRLWLNEGSCIRLRPERRNYVWFYDFVEAQAHDGRNLRLLALIDEITREYLAIRVAHRINGLGVLEIIAHVMLTRGMTEIFVRRTGQKGPQKSLEKGLLP